MKTAVTAVKTIAAAIAAWWGDLSVFYQTLIILVGIDYFSGVIAAAITKTLSSDVGLRGLLKKGMIFLMVAAAHFMQRLIEQSSGLDIPLGSGAALAAWFSGNELLSIAENCKRSGVSVPDWLMKAVEAVKGQGSKPAPK